MQQSASAAQRPSAQYVGMGTSLLPNYSNQRPVPTLLLAFDFFGLRRQGQGLIDEFEFAEIAAYRILPVTSPCAVRFS